MKRIVYTRPDGGVSVVLPCISGSDQAGFTEEQALARALSKDVPANATDVRVVDATAIPTDRTYRNAWTLTANGIEVDAVKAAAIAAATKA